MKTVNELAELYMKQRGNKVCSDVRERITTSLAFFSGDHDLTTEETEELHEAVLQIVAEYLSSLG
jgi:hypothetical protein